MAVQMRRGPESEFDPSKMLPGEWAVSLDTKYIRMCFSPGVCLRMATYEAFEADMAEIQAILAEAKTIQEAVARIQTEINNTAVVVEDYSILAKSYAVGGTGTRENEDIDNAKYYYKQTKQISQGINGIIPMGTVTFAELPTTDIVKNAMYNVSDAFTSDERFNDGGGVSYGPGNNVIYTAEGKWDVTASSAVTGIKGAKEDTYRQGNVNITAKDVGALPEQSSYNVSADAHNITTPGIYTVGAECKNVPFSTGWGVMIVSNLDNNPAYTNQLLFSVDKNKFYKKQCENGVWPDEWDDNFHGKRISTDDNKVGMSSNNEGGNVWFRGGRSGRLYELDEIGTGIVRLFRYTEDDINTDGVFNFDFVTGKILFNSTAITNWEILTVTTVSENITLNRQHVYRMGNVAFVNCTFQVMGELQREEELFSIDGITNYGAADFCALRILNAGDPKYFHCYMPGGVNKIRVNGNPPVIDTLNEYYNIMGYFRIL